LVRVPLSQLAAEGRRVPPPCPRSDVSREACREHRPINRTGEA
jgi:hypothetical protein